MQLSLGDYYHDVEVERSCMSNEIDAMADELSLDAIAEKLDAGDVIKPVTVREFLGWFSAQRRGANVVWEIRQHLDKAGLKTVPDFETLWIDAPLEIRRATKVAEGNNLRLDAQDSVTEPVVVIPDSVTSAWLIKDPTYRIGKLDAANKPVERVGPDQPVSLAVTKMLSRDYSQLPVMTNDRDVKGLISWRSIGSRLALGITPQFVRDAMDPAQEIIADSSIFEAIPWIVRYDYVLVRAEDKRVTGIVTASDLSLQFQRLTEPFLILSEVENLIRNLIGNRFTPSELAEMRDASDRNRPILNVADLTFGEYVRLLENPDRWERLSLNIDRTLFCQDLDKVRIIRNNIMHFDSDGIGNNLDILRDFAQFLKRLEKLRH